MTIGLGRGEAGIQVDWFKMEQSVIHWEVGTRDISLVVVVGGVVVIVVVVVVVVELHS